MASSNQHYDDAMHMLKPETIALKAPMISPAEESELQSRMFSVIGTEFLRLINDSKSNRDDAIECLLRLVRTALTYARPVLRAKLLSVQCILLFREELDLAELEAAMKNVTGLSAADIFFKTFINLPPTSLLWAKAREYLASASKISTVATGIQGLVDADDFKGLVASMTLPIEDRDLAATHALEQIAFKLLSQLEAHADLIKSSQTSSLVSSMRDVVEKFVESCLIPLAAALFHAFDTFVRDLQPRMTRLVEVVSEAAGNFGLSSDMTESIMAFVAKQNEACRQMETVLRNTSKAADLCGAPSASSLVPRQQALQFTLHSV